MQFRKQEQARCFPNPHISSGTTRSLSLPFASGENRPASYHRTRKQCFLLLYTFTFSFFGYVLMRLRMNAHARVGYGVIVGYCVPRSVAVGYPWYLSL